MTTGIDLTGAEGGRLAAAFALGCTSTWVFVRNLVMRPAIKSCHQRISELEEDRKSDRKRIADLELALFLHGNGEMRAAMQGAVSELHVDIMGIKEKLDRKDKEQG